MNSTDQEEAAAKLPKSGRAKVLIRGVLMAAGICFLLLIAFAAVTAFYVLNNNHATILVNQDTPPDFKGIDKYLKAENAVADVVIIHGISEHCLGYSDALIADITGSLTGEDSGGEPPAMQAAFKAFDNANKQAAANMEAVYPPLEADCAYRYESAADYAEKIEVGEDKIKGPDFPGDLQFVLAAQTALCDAINDAESGSAQCFKLGVYEEDGSPYATGFVRVVNSKGLRFFELVWSPATRWIKDRLVRLEASNRAISDGALNQFLKSHIINNAVADAVAYLADPGVLVNFNLLQTFCLVVATTTEIPIGQGDAETPNDDRDFFICNADHLLSARDFDERHRLFLISHSLGTRVLLDTLGLLASDELIGEIQDRFELIKANIPGEYSDSADNGFSSLLQKVTPTFLTSIDAIYAFTNQVPLLSANLTSPFERPPLPQGEKYEAMAKAFKVFLEKRGSTAGDDRKLQIVSFHDPDDLLSYQLGCWYYRSSIRYSAIHANLVEQEYEQLAGDLDLDDKKDYRPLLRALENLYCPEIEQAGWSERTALYPNQQPSSMQTIVKKIKEELEEDEQAVFVDTPLRMQAIRLPGVLAHPLDVHSNYYRDKKVHQWISNGYQ